MRPVALLAIIVTSMLTAPAPARAQVREAKRILMIYGHDPNAPGVVVFMQQLKAVLRERIPNGTEFYDENLDLDRFPDPERSAQLARYFAEKYQDFQPDVIVTEGAQALRFAVDRLVRLFPNVPIVYGLAFEPVVDYSTLPRHVTGRRLRLPFDSTFLLARALHPDAERVVVVVGSSARDSLLVSEARRAITPLLKGMELAVLENWSYGGLLDSLRRLPPRTFVILSGLQRDQRGREFNTADLVASLTSVASVPMYGIARNWVGDGIVGGSVMDFGDDGTRVGRILVRVLAKEPIPPGETAANPLVVDWRQLQRWGVSEDRLPPNTQVLFRTLSLWERYAGVILSVIAVIALESLLIALLLVERRRRVRAQRAAEETRGQVEHMARVATLSDLAAAVSHELRQPLTAIRVNAAAGTLLLARTPVELDEARLALVEIERDSQRASEVIENFRLLLRKQDPVSTTVDLNAVCRETGKLVEHEVSSRKARLILQLDPDIAPVRGDPVQLQQAVINLTLNALDALSASLPREAMISTVASNGDVQVQVSDSGPGLSSDVQRRLFEPFFSTKPHGLGLGLTIVRSIVERHRGKLRAENRPAGGAVFTMTLPPDKASAHKELQSST